jgi:hypothetical protein
MIPSVSTHAQTRGRAQICGLEYAVYLRFVALIPLTPYFTLPGSPDWLLPEGLLPEWSEIEEAEDYLCEADRLADLLFVAVALHLTGRTLYLDTVTARAGVLINAEGLHTGRWLIVALARAKQRVQGQIGFWTYGDEEVIVQMGAVTWQEMVVPPLCA